jgi:carbonic anhydrase
VAGAKAIVVLGHTKCGAIMGACDGVKMGNLTGLLQKVDEAIALETETTVDRTSKNPQFVQRVAEHNVLLVKRQVMERSPVLAAMISQSALALVGGMYDVDSGAVEFYDSRMLLGSA